MHPSSPVSSLQGGSAETERNGGADEGIESGRAGPLEVNGRVDGAVEVREAEAESGRNEKDPATSNFAFVSGPESPAALKAVGTAPLPRAGFGGDMGKTKPVCTCLGVNWLQGVKDDLRRRLPLYVSDWTDGLNPLILSSALLLFFAQAAPAMSFGEAMFSRTDGEIGVVETLFSTAVTSMIYAVLAGQPLVIVGVTGPSTVLYGTMYQLSEKLDIDFIPWMAWVCIWAAIILVILAFANATNLIVFVTRFTAESFEFLVAVTYFSEAISELSEMYKHSELTNALASTIYAFGVMAMALALHHARTWPYFNKAIREELSNYGVAITILVFTGASYLPRLVDADVERLNVPESWNWQPTTGRSWLVDFTSVDAGAIFGAIIPGFLLAILYHFDTTVSSLLSQKQEFNLKKGPAFHYDLIIQALLVLICGLFGLPAVNGLLPQSPLHVRSLAKIEEEVLPDGRKRETYSMVHENRISPTLHAALFFVALGVLWLPSRIPIGVFIGVFFYLGFTTFMGNSLTDRLLLLFVDKKLRGDHHLAKVVPFFSIVKFSLIQFVLVMIIYVVGEHLGAVGVIFPLLIVLLIPLRQFGLSRLFSAADLKELDGNVHEDTADFEPAHPPEGEVDATRLHPPVMHGGNFNRAHLMAGEWLEPYFDPDLEGDGNHPLVHGSEGSYQHMSSPKEMPLNRAASQPPKLSSTKDGMEHDLDDKNEGLVPLVDKVTNGQVTSADCQIDVAAQNEGTPFALPQQLRHRNSQSDHSVRDNEDQRTQKPESTSADH